MEIKELEKNEIKKVVEFYGEVVLPEEKKEEELESFEKEISEGYEKDHMLVAIEDDKVVGFLRSQICEGKNGKKVDKVIIMLISPDKLGFGIGGQLLEEERCYAKKMCVDVLDIETR
jgi:GNAT superfamily N-acetyltransferase